MEWVTLIISLESISVSMVTDYYSSYLKAGKTGEQLISNPRWSPVPSVKSLWRKPIPPCPLELDWNTDSLLVNCRTDHSLKIRHKYSVEFWGACKKEVEALERNLIAYFRPYKGKILKSVNYYWYFLETTTERTVGFAEWPTSWNDFKWKECSEFNHAVDRRHGRCTRNLIWRGKISTFV